MLRPVIACLLLWLGQKCASGLRRQEEPSRPYKMKRSATLDSPAGSVREELLQTLFINQLDSRVALAGLTETAQETKKLLEDFYQTFSTHLSEHKISRQGADSMKNFTEHLLGEVEELQEKVLQQGNDAEQMKNQLLQKEEIIQQHETTLQHERDVSQQLRATIREKEDALQRTKEENEKLKREVGLGEEEYRRLQEELLRAKEAEAESRRDAARYAGCASRLQQLTQDNQGLTDLNARLDSNNTALQTQARLAQRLQGENRRLRDEKDGLREELEECQENAREGSRSPEDCGDLQVNGLNQPGVHKIFPQSSPAGVNVYCEFVEGQSWTVFLSRRLQSPQEAFNRHWQDYKDGFGDPHGEYWLGNDNLHALTGGSAPSRLRVEAKNLRGERRFGEWTTFRVGDEASRYKLSVGGYVTSSTLGDSLVSKYNLSGMSFSTIDRDHDKSPFGRCVLRYGDGGWWYRWCSYVSPTAPIGNSDDINLMSWGYFTPEDETQVGLKELKMMLLRRRV